MPETATLTVSPDPVTAGNEVTVTASGLNPGQLCDLVIGETQSTGMQPLQADAGGNVAGVVRVYWVGPATASIQVQQGGGHWKVIGSTGFTID